MNTFVDLCSEKDTLPEPAEYPYSLYLATFSRSPNTVTVCALQMQRASVNKCTSEGRSVNGIQQLALA